MGKQIIIPSIAQPYAELQFGALDMLRNNPHDWMSAVDIMTEIRYESIKQYLPDNCNHILDIGGGVAISDIPILRHYDGAAKLTVIDGETEAKVKKHNSPFNSEQATRALLEANGLELYNYINPDVINRSNPVEPFDIVLSFAAWGFHFSPELYCDFVRANTKYGSLVVLDMRHGKANWRSIMDIRFRFIDVAHRDIKFDRLVYERR